MCEQTAGRPSEDSLDTDGWEHFLVLPNDLGKVDQEQVQRTFHNPPFGPVTLCPHWKGPT